MKFHKYQALGNDYIVINPRETNVTLNREIIQWMCDRQIGIGADGVLYGPVVINKQLQLRIFNPDGSEAEKSGNGLRIFARYLWDHNMVQEETFTIQTLSGSVTAQMLENGERVGITMGTVSFQAVDIPVTGEVINKQLEADGRVFTYSAATIGNPHCVIIVEELSPELAKRFGPFIEKNTKFLHRTNVQFVKVIDRNTIQIEIWERGAGYTLASGSSSVAAAAVTFKLKLCNNVITVKMPGGELQTTLTDDFMATIEGPVIAVYDGVTNERIRMI